MAFRVDLGKRTAACGALFAALAIGGGVQAQSYVNGATGDSGAYNSGYGRTTDQENQPVVATMRDANGNLVIVDGMIQAGQDQSVFSNAGAGGAFDTAAGVGASGAATAFGNNLVVVTQGNYNTVIVNSKQTNTGNVSASSSLNGGVSNGQ